MKLINSKKLISLITMLFGMLSINNVQAQSIPDPFVNSATVTTAPTTFGSTTNSITFQFLNVSPIAVLNASPLTNIYIQLSDFEVTGTFNAANITGSAASLFTWTYNSTTKIITGTFIGTLNSFNGGIINIAGLTVSNYSQISTPTVGFSVTIITDPTNNASSSNDFTSSYTYTAGPIIPITENGTVSTLVGGTAITNVASNDSINGPPATLGFGGNATVSQSGIWPTGITLNPATGAITVVPLTPPGAYPVTYELCDLTTPTPICSTMVDTIFVTPAIDPETESGTVTTATGGTALANIASNDSVNGFPATVGTGGNATVSQVGTWPTGVTLDPTTGIVSVVPLTTPGTYIITYELCDLSSPPNCATMIDTVFVTPLIDPETETGIVSTITGGIALTNIASNDSVNGYPATLGTTGNATVSIIGTLPPGITFDPNTGTMTVAPLTPIGTYPITYLLCDKLVPVNCAAIVDNIIVTPVINPATETGTVTTIAGGTALTNIASNDSVNGYAATIGPGGNATISQVGTWPSGISLDSTTGAVTVAPYKPPGTYPITYELCDFATPTANCATMIDTVIVTPEIKPATETGTVTTIAGGTALTNIVSNDSVNGFAATIGTSGNATISQVGTWPSGISLDPTTGTVTVAPYKPPGTYPITYELCDLSTPTANCATMIDTVIVTPLIVPVTESGTVTSAAGGTALVNIASNDTTNGFPATLGSAGNSTVAQVGIWPTGITLNPTTGAVTVTPGTFAASYPVAYELCDKITPIANCAFMVDTVHVIPVADTITTAIPICPTCPLAPVCATQNDIDTAGGGTTYTTCGIPNGYTMSGPDANGCVTFTGNGTADTVMDTTCVVACKNGMCDTTFILIPPPVKPDTIITIPTCGTCPTASICPTADDLPTTPGVETYFNCGISATDSTQGTFVVDATGCAIWTPNGTQLDTIKTCIVKCLNALCDTTFLIFPPTTSVLPVGLLSFSGQIINQANVLNWTTGSERNNQYFEIYHGKDLSDLTLLSSMLSKAPNGNSDKELNYYYIHNNPAKGHNYYQLHSLDFNGQRAIHNTINLNKSSQTSIRIYPNPTSDELKLTFTKVDIGVVFVKIRDLTGKLIYAERILPTSDSFEWTISMKSFADGIYLLNLRDDLDFWYNLKVEKK